MNIYAVFTVRQQKHSSFFNANIGWGDVPFHLKFSLKVTHPSKKCRLRPISAYNVSTVRANEKSSSIVANRKSAIFVNKNQFKLCYKVSLCEKFQRQRCSRTIHLSNGVYILAVNVTHEPNIQPKVIHPFNKADFDVLVHQP